ncbi:hypothetical protein RND81_13G123000 [Saponaria officinalis]|uniref:Transposase n=1 Tax=Saponaria officinalis TaxID=3572 RepID=A0AAW1H1N2_SAPOF
MSPYILPCNTPKQSNAYVEAMAAATAAKEAASTATMAAAAARAAADVAMAAAAALEEETATAALTIEIATAAIETATLTMWGIQEETTIPSEIIDTTIPEEQIIDMTIPEEQEGEAQVVPTCPVRKKNRMSNETRRLLAQMMLLGYKNSKLKHGLLTKLGQEFNLSRMTIHKYWLTVKQQITEGKLVAVDRDYKGSKKRVIIDLETVRSIPLFKRSSVRSLACAMNINPSTVHKLIKKGKIRAHSNAMKPQLTEGNKIARMQWVLDRIRNLSSGQNLEFEENYNVVHIDEKWFYMSRVSQKFYLLLNEKEPHRSCTSKTHMTKIMFMGASARPRISNGVVNFDGKIGIFPFSCIVPAKKTSKNRRKGTLETRPIARITKAVIKTCLIEKILPTIKDKWPDRRGQTIYIQQDNARPHISPNDPDFRRAATADGWDIQLIFQPPNSPDLNILDLGHFMSIQTIQHEKAPRSVVQLVDAVLRSYEEINPISLNYTWLTLLSCMNEILKVKGSNRYKIPHIGKKRLDRLGFLPTTILPEVGDALQAVIDVTRAQVAQLESQMS